MTADFRVSAEVCKVDQGLGLVFGWAIVCKQDGVEYFDLQEEHVPEQGMLEASLDFMLDRRVSKEMHAGESQGTVVFAFPLTTEIAKAFEITTKKTGLIIGVKPNASMLAKFVSGELTGFSIGGKRLELDGKPLVVS